MKEDTVIIKFYTGRYYGMPQMVEVSVDRLDLHGDGNTCLAVFRDKSRGVAGVCSIYLWDEEPALRDIQDEVMFQYDRGNYTTLSMSEAEPHFFA